MTLRRLTPLRRRAGFSLIEVMTALLIFSVALVGYVENIGQTVRTQTDLLGRQRARMLAENVLEEMRFSGQWEEGTDDGDFEGDDMTYRWTTLVEPVEDETITLDRITVTIEWNDGRDQSYELETMMAPLGTQSSMTGMETIGAGMESSRGSAPAEPTR